MRKASLRSRPSSDGCQPRAVKTPESNPIPSPKLQGFPRKITLACFHVDFCHFLILISLPQRTKKTTHFSKHSKKSAYSSMRLCKSLLKQRPDVTRSLQGCKRWHRWVMSPKKALEKAALPLQESTLLSAVPILTQNSPGKLI